MWDGCGFSNLHSMRFEIFMRFHNIRAASGWIAIGLTSKIDLRRLAGIAYSC